MIQLDYDIEIPDQDKNDYSILNSKITNVYKIQKWAPYP